VEREGRGGCRVGRGWVSEACRSEPGTAWGEGVSLCGNEKEMGDPGKKGGGGRPKSERGRRSLSQIRKSSGTERAHNDPGNKTPSNKKPPDSIKRVKIREGTHAT